MSYLDRLRGTGNPIIDNVLGLTKDFSNPLGANQNYNTPGINPNEPNPHQQMPQQPQKAGVLGTVDNFLNKPGGSFLMNLLAQSGYSDTPQSPFGAIGRAGVATQQQDLNRRLIEARLGGKLGGTEDPSIVRTFDYFEKLGDPKNPDKLTEAQKRFLSVQRAENVKDIAGMGLNRVVGGELENIVPEDPIVGGLRNRSGATEGGKQEAITAAIPEQVRVRSEAEALTKLPSDLASLDSSLANADATIAKIDNILPLTDQAGLPVYLRSNLPGKFGGDPRTLAKAATSLKSNFAFDTLQKMRAASKSGGALGQVSERELDLLVNALEAIDIEGDPDVLRENLMKVRTHYQNYKTEIARMKDAMRQQAGQEIPDAPAPTRRRFNPATGKVEDIT